MFSELKILGRVTLVYHHESLFSVRLNRRLESHRWTCAHITDIAHTLDPANTIHTWEVMKVKANSPFEHYFVNTLPSWTVPGWWKQSQASITTFENFCSRQLDTELALLPFRVRESGYAVLLKDWCHVHVSSKLAFWEQWEPWLHFELWRSSSARHLC